jgi:hypothetical protein
LSGVDRPAECGAPRRTAAAIPGAPHDDAEGAAILMLRPEVAAYLHHLEAHITTLEGRLAARRRENEKLRRKLGLPALAAPQIR